jgi:hypothetical protein
VLVRAIRAPLTSQVDQHFVIPTRFLFAEFVGIQLSYVTIVNALSVPKVRVNPVTVQKDNIVSTSLSAMVIRAMIQSPLQWVRLPGSTKTVTLPMTVSVVVAVQDRCSVIHS